MMNNISQLMQMLPQLKANPMQFILNRKFNVPQNMVNDPNQIINHLLQTRQISQQQVNSAYQQVSQFRR